MYYNPKIDKYRCILRYSWPGVDCSTKSKYDGDAALLMYQLPSASAYKDGIWKMYQYWYEIQNIHNNNY